MLTRYGLVRLLYRLSVSAYAPDFLLRGALLFQLWHELPHRPTRDADSGWPGAQATFASALAALVYPRYVD